jgi:hypothetical protein
MSIPLYVNFPKPAHLKMWRVAIHHRVSLEIMTWNSRDTILHRVKDQAYHKSSIMSPGYHTISKVFPIR